MLEPRPTHTNRLQCVEHSIVLPKAIALGCASVLSPDVVLVGPDGAE
jgi:hypothetical protein